MRRDERQAPSRVGFQFAMWFIDIENENRESILWKMRAKEIFHRNVYQQSVQHSYSLIDSRIPLTTGSPRHDHEYAKQEPNRISDLQNTPVNVPT